MARSSRSARVITLGDTVLIGVSRSLPTGTAARVAGGKSCSHSQHSLSITTMFISDFAIKRPVVTVATMLAIAGFGAFALGRLKTDELPDVKFPVVGVMLAYPGASPEGVEREVLDPIEDRIAGISGVDKLESTVRDGSAQIAVYFDFDKDVQSASQQVRDAIAEIRGDLPVEMEEPTIMHFDPADAPVMSLTLTSTTLDAAKLTRVADPELTRKLLGVPGVAHVTLSGGRERELTVALQPGAMRALSVSVRDIVAALQTQNLATPVGHVIGKRDERSIRFRGRLADRAAFEAVIVSRRGTQLVRLGEVATITDGAEEPRSLALYNAEPALGLDVIKAHGYSTTAVTEALHAELAMLRPTLPPGTRLEVVQDAGARVAESVHSVQRALIEGAVLTVLVVFLFLNSWRSTVITGLALPISVLAAFVAVWAFGFTLNMMTLLGLSLAIGILIDDAIVVRENIVRHVELGRDHETAARIGTSEIGLAVAATTFSIVAVFVPIAFMGGIAGQWFKPFALTMASSVLVSLFISVLARPDAVGALAGSAHAGTSQGVDHAPARPLQPLVRSYRRALSRRVGLGARSPGGNGRHRDRLVCRRPHLAGARRRNGLHAEHGSQ